MSCGGTALTVVFPGVAYLATWPRIVGCLAALLRLRGGDRPDLQSSSCCRARPVRGAGTIPPVDTASVGDEPWPAGADTGSWRFAMSVLPERPSLEHLRKQAKARRRERGIPLSQAQHELAREYGFASWPKLVHTVQAGQLARRRAGVGACRSASTGGCAERRSGQRSCRDRPVCPRCWCCCAARSAPRPMSGIAPRLLLDAGADPDSQTVEWGGEGRMSALFDCGRAARLGPGPAAARRWRDQ